MPFLAFIQQIIANFDQFYRKITVSALNVNEGVIEYFTDENLAKDEFHKAAFSSTCIPGAFPNYHWEQPDGTFKNYSDNFMLTNVNTESVITRCLELVDDESKITIDVLLLGEMKDIEIYDYHDPNAWDWQNQSWNALGYFMRARDIGYIYSNSNSIFKDIDQHPNVNWRYIVQQENALNGTGQLFFSPETTWPLQEEGRRVAQDILANP